MEKIEELDALRMENLSLRKAMAEKALGEILAEMDRNGKAMQEKYSLKPEDRINPQTLEIIRCPAPPPAPAT